MSKLKIVTIDGEEFYMWDSYELTPEMERYTIQTREESQWAWKHTLYHTEEAGFERGVEQGIEQVRIKAEAEKLEIARKVLKEGISVEVVGQITGVDLAVISKLKLELEEA